ncbi:MAG: phage tail protein, partial [Clostridium sp.]|nr:phage tail protein [Clostridium sp.]
MGTIIAYGANDWYKPSEASKWLLCDGSPVDVSKYPKLAALMAYTPNLIGKFPQGSLTAGNEIKAGLPNSIGSFYQDVNAEHSGAITGMAYTYRRGH